MTRFHATDKESGVPLSRNKFGNHKQEVDGRQFDSTLEADAYIWLRELECEGKIQAFELQPVFLLQEEFEKLGKKFQPIRYIADFLITWPDGTREVVDTKGERTDVYLLKRKLFEFRYPELRIVELKKDDLVPLQWLWKTVAPPATLAEGIQQLKKVKPKRHKKKPTKEFAVRA